MSYSSKTTIDYLLTSDISYRKKRGQYFTNDALKKDLLDNIPLYSGCKVLEPSGGTGEFVEYLKRVYNSKVYSYELDPILASSLECSMVYNEDFLRNNRTDKYDFIVGNPPYFELKGKNSDDELKSMFNDIVYGRVNIYSLFIKKSIDMLNDGGYLGFVIPSSIMNGKYFSKLREYIISVCSITYMKLCNTNDFEGANQSVLNIVIRKCANDGKYIINRNGYYLLSTEYKKINDSMKNKNTLVDLGFKVETGSVSWCHSKEKLSDDKNDTLLIWSNNIVDGSILLREHPKKKQYVKNVIPKVGPAIVVNRVVSYGKLRCCYIEEGQEFLGENHVNIIFSKDNSAQKLKELLTSLISKETQTMIKDIIGNTQVSQFELERVIAV